jgi:hypothetical protein
MAGATMNSVSAILWMMLPATIWLEPYVPVPPPVFTTFYAADYIAGYRPDPPATGWQQQASWKWVPPADILPEAMLWNLPPARTLLVWVRYPTAEEFAACLSGPGPRDRWAPGIDRPPLPGCAFCDLDGDDDVDLRDYAVLSRMSCAYAECPSGHNPPLPTYWPMNPRPGSYRSARPPREPDPDGDGPRCINDGDCHWEWGFFCGPQGYCNYNPQPIIISCDDHGVCPEGLVCSDHWRCEDPDLPPEPPTPQCYLDIQCGTGDVCQDGHCVPAPTLPPTPIPPPPEETEP